MNGFVLRLCWKNIWRNKRRTLITVNAIGIGVMALVWVRNYYDTFHEQAVGNAVRYSNGHLLVTHRNFDPKKPPRDLIKNPGPIYKWLMRQSSVTGVSPQIMVQGLLSTSQGANNIWFKGVEPKLEAKTTGYASSMVAGRFFGTKHIDNPIVLGTELATELDAVVGSKVVALTQGVDGSIGNELFNVVGIFKTDSKYDGHLAFIHNEDARKLLSVSPGAIHQISVILKDSQAIGDIQKRFNKKFRSTEAQMLSWEEVQKNLMAMIELNRSANVVLMIIIVLISGLGIANSILMSLLERKREFGVMMAVGTQRKEVMQMVAMETILLGVVGVTLGNIMGVGLTLYFNQYGFDLSWFTDHALVVNGALIQTISYPEVRLHNSVTVTSVILLLSVVVAFFPVKHISKLNLVKALRSN